jgi:hypothetical protein
VAARSDLALEMEDAGPLWAVTRGVVPLRLYVTRRLTCCRCLPFLLASQTALTPSANPLGKPGLHHAYLPLLHGRAMASQAGRVAAPPADPRLVMPADVSAQAQSRFQAYARGTKPSVRVTFRSVVMGKSSRPVAARELGSSSGSSRGPSPLLKGCSLCSE